MTQETREGWELEVGDTVTDGFGVKHLITRIAEYPARFFGRQGEDHARIAYADHWERTIADHELFHVAV